MIQHINHHSVLATTRGLTLVETLVAIAAGTATIIALSGFVLSFYRTNTYAIEQSFAVNSARRGIERMVRDMRETTYSDEGAFPIITASPYTLYFYSDVDRDTNVERIRFYLENGLLKKEQTKSVGDPPTYTGGTTVTTVVSDYVRNSALSVPLFKYYNAAGVEITNPSNIRDVVFVTVNVVVNINPLRLPSDFSLRSSATLRNLKAGS
ncbi:MAG: hypothetical protein HGA67_01705 [Candidatus Yonathbacteria bacterium]|nr:hypothetical protein [Candidatus Yonathbacteria bacterium]